MVSSGYDDLKMVKLLLDMNEKLKNEKPDRTQELILFGASLEALRDVKEKVERIHERLNYIEIKPQSQLQEKSLMEQIQDLSAKEKDSLIEFLSPKQPEEQYNNDMQDAVEIGPIESVAARKKVLIKNTVGKYGKLTSFQLAKIIGLSRTRCNEYLKELELAGELTAFTTDKKRYYQLKN